MPDHNEAAPDKPTGLISKMVDLLTQPAPEGANCPHCGHYCHGKSVFCTPPIDPDCRGEGET